MLRSMGGRTAQAVEFGMPGVDSGESFDVAAQPVGLFT